MAAAITSTSQLDDAKVKAIEVVLQRQSELDRARRVLPAAGPLSP